MIIDCHGHVSAPAELWAYKASVISHRGAHGRGKVEVSDDAFAYRYITLSKPILLIVIVSLPLGPPGFKKKRYLSDENAIPGVVLSIHAVFVILNEKGS